MTIYIRVAYLQISGGDMRRAITYLQSLHRLSAANITMDTLYMVAGVIPQVSSSNSYSSFPRKKLMKSWQHANRLHFQDSKLPLTK